MLSNVHFHDLGTSSRAVARTYGTVRKLHRHCVHYYPQLSPPSSSQSSSCISNRIMKVASRFLSNMTSASTQFRVSIKLLVAAIALMLQPSLYQRCAVNQAARLSAVQYGRSEATLDNQIVCKPIVSAIILVPPQASHPTRHETAIVLYGACEDVLNIKPTFFF